MSRKRKQQRRMSSYPPEFRLRVLREILEEKTSAAHLERDFELHGTPWVLRFDRWKAHVAPRAMGVLKAHEVLQMHGPPYCPRFHGQLERQNREHRGWLESGAAGELQLQCDEMREVFNELLPKRRLRWKTPGEV